MMRHRRHLPAWAGCAILLAALCARSDLAAAQSTIVGVSALTSTGDLTASNAGTCASSGTGCRILLLGGYTGVSVQITGTYSGATFQFEVTTNRTTWRPVSLTPTNSTTPATNASANGMWQGLAFGSAFRVRASAFSSGTATVTIRATLSPMALGGTGGGGGGSGTVTSVDLAAPAIFTVSGNPVESSGTLTLTLANQTANRVFAGPTTGSPAAPSFRSLVAGDLPDLSTTYVPTTRTVNGNALSGNVTVTFAQLGSKPTTVSGFGITDAVTLTGSENLTNKTLTSPALVTPTLGVASATSINKVAITAPATSATLTLADGSTLATSGAFSATLTTTAATNVTLPTSGNLMGSSGVWTANHLTCASDTTGKVFVDCGAQISDFPTISGTPAQGDLLYFTGASTTALLNKDANATRYLSNTGTTNNPAWAQVNLTNGVTGDLPFANFTAASAASKLLGRGSASGAGDYEEITIGSGLTMTGTTLSSSGGGGATTALDNLAAVAINTALLDDVAGTDDFGSATKPWKDYYLAGSSVTPATNNFKITGTSTSGTRVLTLADGDTTLVAGTMAPTVSPSFTTPALGAATGTSLVLTDTTNASLAVGRNGNTNPAFRIDDSTASAVNGLSLTPTASGNGVTLQVISSGANDGITIKAKGSGIASLWGGNSSASYVQLSNTSTNSFLQFGNLATNQTMRATFGDAHATDAAFHLIDTADTTATAASTEQNTMYVNPRGPLNHANGALTINRMVRLDAPTYRFASGTQTLTDAATLGIAGAPLGGTSAAIGTSSGLLVSAGACNGASTPTLCAAAKLLTPTGGTTNVDLILGTTGVSLTNDGDGALTVKSLSAGSAEDLTVNLDDTADTAVWSSSTGLNLWTLTSITMNAAAYQVAGAATVTGASCTAWTSGLCTTAGPAPLMTMNEMAQEILALRAQVAALQARSDRR